MLDDDVRAVILTYDAAYAHMADTVFERLQQVWDRRDVPLVLSRIDADRNLARHADAPSQSDATRAACGSGSCGCAPRSLPAETSTSAPAPSLLGARTLALPAGTPMASTATLYLGGESRALTHLLLSLGPSYPVASFDPATGRARRETGQTNRLLMRRYATIQKARDASVVGLVIGTLGIHAYLPLLKELRRVLTSPISRRKVYTISVGKLNPAKLANFQEIDAFVLVACPENSLLDTREFQKPIVTPWEMMLAVQAHGGQEVAWSGAYELDLAAVLGTARDLDVAARPADDDDDDRPHFSFATGTYVSRTRYGDDEHAEDDGTPSDALARLDLTPHQLTVRDPTTGQLTRVLDSAALAHRTQRTWHGLDPAEGEPQAAVLEQGLDGFAQQYRAMDGTKEGDSLPRHEDRDLAPAS